MKSCPAEEKNKLIRPFRWFNRPSAHVFYSDFMAFFDRVHKDRKGLEGKNIRLDRVPICSCIQVKGLRKETSRDTIELYFENNRKSGGGHVSHVEKTEKDEALVYFENPSSK